MEAIFKGRAGTLENTVFTILNPEATTHLVRPNRSPQMAYPNPHALAAALQQIAAKYPAKAAPSALPAMQDFRLSLNTAACDSMPLVVAIGGGEALAAKLAWTPELLGKYAFAPVSTKAELKSAGLTLEPGIYALEPDAFGQKATVLAQWPLMADVASVTRGLLEAQKKHNGEGKNAQEHIANGTRLGVLWKSLVPNTDPHGPKRR